MRTQCPFVQIGGHCSQRWRQIFRLKSNWVWVIGSLNSFLALTDLEGMILMSQQGTLHQLGMLKHDLRWNPLLVETLRQKGVLLLHQSNLGGKVGRKLGEMIVSIERGGGEVRSWCCWFLIGLRLFHWNLIKPQFSTTQHNHHMSLTWLSFCVRADKLATLIFCPLKFSVSSLTPLKLSSSLSLLLSAGFKKPALPCLATCGTNLSSSEKAWLQALQW